MTLCVVQSSPRLINPQLAQNLFRDKSYKPLKLGDSFEKTYMALCSYEVQMWFKIAPDLYTVDKKLM